MKIPNEKDVKNKGAKIRKEDSIELNQKVDEDDTLNPVTLKKKVKAKSGCGRALEKMK